MSKKITSIGYEIPGHSNLAVEFSSKQSLMDSDIVLLAPELPYYERSSAGGGYYLGKVCYGESGSFRLKEDVLHWRKEMTNALLAGKTVFLLLSGREDYYVDTGTRSYSGTGRSRSTTINVTNGHNYELLPATIGTIHTANGKEIIPTTNQTFKSFYEYFSPYLEYRLYLESIGDGKQIFTGKDKTKTLGAYYKVGAGHLVVLPYLNYDEEKFTEEKKDKAGKVSTYWTKKAIEFGTILVSKLIEIDREFTSTDSQTPPPSWAVAEEYKSDKEHSIESRLKEEAEKIAAAQEGLKKLETELAKEQFIKELLYAQGKNLENAVMQALEILGFKAENFDDGVLEFDQVITSPEGERFIGECEGKDASAINIDKFRQLEENIQSDLQREEVESPAIGILFGNGFRLTPPKERAEQFTAKCLASAKRGTILIRTMDLYPVARHLQKTGNEEYAKECRKTIVAARGGVVEFPSPPEK